MGTYNSFDGEMEGQLTIEDIFSSHPERMVAVSNIFARARKNMSVAEQKTFVLALSQLEWTKAPNEQSNIVHIDKKTLQSVLGYKSDSTDISENIWREIKDLAPHSHIEIADRDKDIYDSGMFITRISRRSNWSYYRIKFEEEYFPLFTGLNEKYITMWSMDIFQMKHKRSMHFYELLRQMSFDRYEVGNNLYTYGWGIKALKEMFDIPKEGKGSYMRSTKNGGFNRSEFEKKILDPICEDLMKCKMIQLVIQENGKPYVKVKNGKSVQGYQFYWMLSQRPLLAEPNEVKAIADRVDKDPQVLKVVRDVLKGEGKKTKNKNAFCDIEQNVYDFDELEEDLLAASYARYKDDPDHMPGQMTIEETDYMP